MRVAMTVEVRGGNACCGERRELRIAFATHVGGAHAAGECAASQFAE